MDFKQLGSGFRVSINNWVVDLGYPEEEFAVADDQAI